VSELKSSWPSDFRTRSPFTADRMAFPVSWRYNVSVENDHRHGGAWHLVVAFAEWLFALIRYMNATDERGNKVVRQKKEVTMEKLKSLISRFAYFGEHVLSTLATRSMLLLMGMWQAAAPSRWSFGPGVRTEKPWVVSRTLGPAILLAVSEPTSLTLRN
jgi:hypothetical protein